MLSTECGCRCEPEKAAAGGNNEDDKMKEMIYFVYNYIQQKERLDKEEDKQEAASPASPASLGSLGQSPGPSSRDTSSSSLAASPYGLLQMVSSTIDV